MNVFPPLHCYYSDGMSGNQVHWWAGQLGSQPRRCLSHAVELIDNQLWDLWFTGQLIAHYEDIAEFSWGDVMEWTFQV